MKARKCPASRNCTAWSGTMKLNRICFSEIASRMIKGAAGRRWRSPSTEATSVTPSFTPYAFWLFLIFCSFPLTSRLFSPRLVLSTFVLCPCSEPESDTRLLQRAGSSSAPALAAWVCSNTPNPAPPLAHTQHSSFPCSLIVMFWVKIWPFSSKKLMHVVQHRVPSSAGWNGAVQVGAAPCSATALLLGPAVRIPQCISFSS